LLETQAALLSIEQTLHSVWQNTTRMANKIPKQISWRSIFESNWNYEQTRCNFKYQPYPESELRLSYLYNKISSHIYFSLPLKSCKILRCFFLEFIMNKFNIYF